MLRGSRNNVLIKNLNALRARVVGFRHKMVGGDFRVLVINDLALPKIIRLPGDFYNRLVGIVANSIFIRFVVGNGGCF